MQKRALLPLLGCQIGKAITLSPYKCGYFWAESTGLTGMFEAAAKDIGGLSSELGFSFPFLDGLWPAYSEDNPDLILSLDFLNTTGLDDSS